MPLLQPATSTSGSCICWPAACSGSGSPLSACWVDHDRSNCQLTRSFRLAPSGTRAVRASAETHRAYRCRCCCSCSCRRRRFLFSVSPRPRGPLAYEPPLPPSPSPTMSGTSMGFSWRRRSPSVQSQPGPEDIPARTTSPGQSSRATPADARMLSSSVTSTVHREPTRSFIPGSFRDHLCKCPPSPCSG